MLRHGRPAGIAAAIVALLLFGGLGCAARSATHAPGNKSTEREARAEPEDVPLIPEAYFYFTTGNMLAAEGNDSAAVGSYQRALGHDPDSREIRLALARSYERMGRYNEAVITAEGIRPRDKRVLEFLARGYAYLRNFPRRLAIYEELATVDSADASVWQFLASAYGATRDTVKEMRALEKLADLAPTPDILEKLGFIQYDIGDKDAAEATFHRAVEQDSTQRATRVLLGLAQIWVDREEPDSAYTYFSKAIALNSGNVMLRKRFVYFLLQEHRLEEALAEARSVLAMSPADPDMLYRTGVLEYSLDEKDSAETHLTRLVTEITDDAMARYVLGRIALENGDTVTAEAQFEQSIFVADTLPEAYLSIGQIYDAHKEYDSSIAVYRRGLNSLPDQENLLFALGAAQERAGQFDNSVQTFERLLKLYPKNAAALNYLGYMLADKGVRLDEALKMIEEAVAQHPDNGAYLDSYGWVLFRLGQNRRALDKLEEALDFVQTDAVVYEHLGDVHSALGQTLEAERYWRKALELEPDNKAVKEKLGN